MVTMTRTMAARKSSSCSPTLRRPTKRKEEPPILPISSPLSSAKSLSSSSSSGALSPKVEDAVSALLSRPRSHHRHHAHQKTHNVAVKTSRNYIVRTFTLFLLVIIGVGVRGRYNALMSRLDYLTSERDELSASNEAALKEKRRLESELKLEGRAKSQVSADLERTRTQKADLERKAEQVRREKEEVERRMDAMEKEDKTRDLQRSEKAKEELRAAIQRQSRREVLQRYGPGPHRVEMKLSFPPNANTGRIEIRRVILEMAPLDLMPHSVYTFLSQVSEKLWNGTEIFRNRNHILMTRLGTNGDRLKDFKDSMLETLGFTEYSPAYPHAKYTLGFAGRPGGPQFYINKIDNLAHHGPNPDTGNPGDPCFAKVVEKADVIDQISGLPTGRADLLDKPVLIREMNVMKLVNGRWLRA